MSVRILNIGSVAIADNSTYEVRSTAATSLVLVVSIPYFLMVEYETKFDGHAADAYRAVHL